MKAGPTPQMTYRGRAGVMKKLCVVSPKPTTSPSKMPCWKSNGTMVREMTLKS
jgi:hypothetical protein